MLIGYRLEKHLRFFSKLIHISFSMGHQCIRRKERGQTTCFESAYAVRICRHQPIAYTHHLLIAVLRFWWCKWKTHWIRLVDNVCSVIMDNSDDFDNLSWTTTTGKEQIKESFCSCYQTPWLSQWKHIELQDDADMASYLELTGGRYHGNFGALLHIQIYVMLCQ